MSSLIARKRADFHHRLIESGTLAISPSGVASNADRSQQFSQRVALAVARALGHSPTASYYRITARPRCTAWSQPDRVVQRGHSPTTSYCVVTARPPVSICPAMSDSPSLSSVDSIGV